MTHLSPSEFVDLIDGALDGGRAAHVERCDACRIQANAVRTMMREANSDETNEPSPLFWDHFQARVRHAISAEPLPRRTWVVLRPLPVFAAAAMIAIVIASAALYPRPGHDAPSAPASGIADQAATDPVAYSSDNPAWALLRDAAADMAIEDAHAAGLTLRAGETENAVLQLTPDERNEFGRLLQNALKHTGA